MTVNGTNFANTSTVDWNGTALSTTFVSGTQLQAVVSASLVANTGNDTITIVTGGVATSNSVIFTVGPVVLNTTSLPNGTVGQTYNQTLVTSGGAAPLTFSVALAVCLLD